MSEAAYYQDATAVTARALENTVANFDNGMNAGGSCAPGIGINIEQGAVVGTPEQFTLLDQSEDVREPQISEQIGGLAYVDRGSVDWPSSGGIAGIGTQPVLTATQPTNAAKVSDPAVDGVPVITGDANLETLANGWVNTAVVP